MIAFISFVLQLSFSTFRCIKTLCDNFTFLHYIYTLVFIIAHRESIVIANVLILRFECNINWLSIKGFCDLKEKPLPSAQGWWNNYSTKIGIFKINPGLWARCGCPNYSLLLKAPPLFSSRGKEINNKACSRSDINQLRGCKHMEMIASWNVYFCLVCITMLL